MVGMALLMLATTTTMAGKAPPPPINGGIVDRNPGSDPWKRSPVRYERGDSNPDISKDIDDIDRQIKRARKSGTMTKAEARGYRREAYVIRKLSVQYGRDGYSASETAELKTRTNALQSLVKAPQ